MQAAASKRTARAAFVIGVLAGAPAYTLGTGVTGCGGRTLGLYAEDSGTSADAADGAPSSSGSGSSSGSVGSSSGIGTGSSSGGLGGSGSSSGGSSGGSSSGSGNSSGSSGGSGSSSGSSSGTCTASPSVTVPPYTNVDRQSACSQAQVSAFVAACGNGTAAQCNDWFSANAACAACINPAADSGAGENSGALLTDAVGQQFLNVAGCVQIVDGNTGCAAPLQELTLCELDACDSPACQSATGADFDNCVTAADNLACASQLTAANNGCGGADSADGGAFTVCNENTPAGLDAVIYEICGNGM